MHVHHQTIILSTNGKGTYSITEQVRSVFAQSGVKQGVATFFVQHTNCSLVIMENAARMHEPICMSTLIGGSENEPYFIHTYEGPDDMPSHIRMVLTGCSETIPIINGQLALGTWQGLFLFEHREAPIHERLL